MSIITIQVIFFYFTQAFCLNPWPSFNEYYYSSINIYFLFILHRLFAYIHGLGCCLVLSASAPPYD